MDDKLLAFLEDYKNDKYTKEDAYEYLKNLPYEDIGHTKIDHHRKMRSGYPEVIFGLGKTKDQIIEIAARIKAREHNILITRIDEDTFKGLLEADNRFEYNKIGRCAILEVNPSEKTKTKVAVVCAGTSDLPVVEEACMTLRAFSNSYEKVVDVGVAGIHRLFDKKHILDSASVIIVCAGMEGALSSVVAGLVDKVVIGVPTSIGYGASFGGVSALLTMLNSCVPSVLTVNIDNGFAAGYAASLINKKN
jgi:NCAIR mutase (PurE)-related protein